MMWAALLYAAVVSLASAQTTCTSGWVDIATEGTPSTCVLFIPSKGTWSDMRSLCQVLGGTDLAMLTGDLHQNVVQYINDHEDLVDEAFWIGGSDEAHEGYWVWTDGTPIPLGTPHWYPCNGQPNGGTEQNYLSLYTPDFYFHSLEGSRQIKAICQA